MELENSTDVSTYSKRGGNILYESNPFVRSMNTKSRKVFNKTGDMALINKDTGEVKSEVSGFWHVEEVDSEKFVKLFANGVAALTEIDQAGLKVFLLLCDLLQKEISKDRVIMSFKDVDQTKTPMGKTTYSRGMRQLIDKGFLAASHKISLYWVNPSFVFNGDRLVIAKEYRLKTQKAIDSNAIEG